MNKLASTAYRLLAVVFLVGIFATAFVYGFLLVFFVLSDSWAVPLELSPTQDRVLAIQPQVATMQATLDRQRIDLAAARGMARAAELQVAETKLLIARFDLGMETEAAAQAAAGTRLDRALGAKQRDIAQTAAATAAATTLLRQVDAELAAKLITSDQAAQRRVALQGALNAATDAKVQAVQIGEQSRQMAGVGAATSLASLAAVKQRVDLQSALSVLEVQFESAKATVVALGKSIAENERVLDVARASPYFAALRGRQSVAFVPYSNHWRAKPGTPVYDCVLMVVACRAVGEVTTLFDAEEYARHPLFKTDTKGRFVGIAFTSLGSAQSPLVFLGRKPLFL